MSKTFKKRPGLSKKTKTYRPESIKKIKEPEINMKDIPINFITNLLSPLFLRKQFKTIFN